MTRVSEERRKGHEESTLIKTKYVRSNVREFNVFLNEIPDLPFPNPQEEFLGDPRISFKKTLNAPTRGTLKS